MLGVLQQLLGQHDAPTLETEVAARQFTMQFPPGTSLDFEGDFLELLHTVTENERMRRLWLLVADQMATEAALDARIARIFEHFDFDGRGCMSTADLEPAVRAAEFHLEAGEIDDIAAGVGGGEGMPEFEVDIHWFRGLIERCQAREDMAARRRAQLRNRSVEMRAEVIGDDDDSLMAHNRPPFACALSSVTFDLGHWDSLPQKRTS